MGDIYVKVWRTGLWFRWKMLYRGHRTRGIALTKQGAYDAMETRIASIDRLLTATPPSGPSAEQGGR